MGPTDTSAHAGGVRVDVFRYFLWRRDSCCTGTWAAGDLASMSLEERTRQVLETVSGVTLSGLEDDKDDFRLRATLTGYAAISALQDSKLATFLTDPTCVLRRLLSLNKYLVLMQSLLRART